MPSIPYVVEQTSRGERSYDIYSRLLEDRIIVLDGEINSTVSASITAQLLYLESKDPKSDIIMYINSPGGSVTAGLAIHDTMNYISCDVSTVVMGMAASMGSFLSSSGAKGKRLVLPNAEIMIHQPLISGGLGGQQTDIMIHAKNLERTRERLETIIARNCDRTYEEVHAACERDNYMTAEEALDFGLVDKIITSR